MADDYTIDSLEEVRRILDVDYIAQEANKRGDLKQLTGKYGIRNHSILARALNEHRLSKSFPHLQRSKLQHLAFFKNIKELTIFCKLYDVRKLEVRQLRKAILEWKSIISKNPMLLLTQQQHEVLIGMLLGDGNIRLRDQNSLFRAEHSEKQKNYVYWTYSLFKEFTTSEPTISFPKGHHKYSMYSFTTFVHPVFNYYRNLFYQTGRKAVTKEILDMLTPRSLAVWVCDDGSYSNSGKQIIMCTNSFTLEEHKLMQEYFKEKWGVNCSVRFRDGKYHYLSFYKKDTQKLISIIKEFIPTQDMNYKIGELK